MMLDQEGQEFIVDPEKFAGEKLRVRLSIDEVLDPPLLRSELLTHPVLKDLGIITFANATNYLIAPEQDTALQALIEGTTETDREAVWWVNQGATYRQEANGELMWAPLNGKDGRPREHWLSLRQAQPGEKVLHYANGGLRAVSTITASAVDAPRPEDLSEEDWGNEGLLVRTSYSELDHTIPLDET